MSGNEHYTFFNQAITSGAEETENGNKSSQMNPTGMTNNSSQSHIGGMVGSQGPTSGASGLRGQDPIGAGARSPIPEGAFRASLISQMDALVQDFRTDKALKSETLYQILKTLLEAGLNEPDWQSTLKEYGLYVDIIAS